MENDSPLPPFSPAPFNPPPPSYSPAPAPGPAAPQHIGLYGWRKRCLYLLILLLVVVILVNLGLTIWILVALNFNTNGMGRLEITESGIRLDGAAEFVGPLYAQNISTEGGSPLRLLSQDNISLSVEDGSSLLLSNSSLNIVAEQLTVSEQTSSTPLLSVSTEGVGVASTRMDVTGSQGLSINGPLETSQVRSPSNQDLQIQSLSGELRLTGGRGLTLRDGPGFDGVTVTSSSDLSITSESGQVVLNAGAGLIQMQGLPRTGQSETYEVCVCGREGTLYLVPASSSCQEDNNICTSP